MSLCIIYSTITVWIIDPRLIQIIIQELEKLYICRDHLAHGGFGFDESESTKSVSFYFFTLLRHIASVNNVVTVLHLLRALHRRIIVYRIL